MTTTNDERAVVTVEARPVASVFGTDAPLEIVQRTHDIASALGTAIKQGGMATKIQGREYVLAEGWAYLGSMLGVFPRTVRVDAMGVDEAGDPQGYEAHVELVTRDGSVVGGAIAECSRIEKSWSDRAPYALKSMAQTRATGKAYRMAFGYVMKAAGYEATPAEEMPDDGPAAARSQPVRGSLQPVEAVRHEGGNDPVGRWTESAHVFVATACEKFQIEDKDVFRLLEVANGDELIEKAQHTDGAWNALALLVKERIEEMPF